MSKQIFIKINDHIVKRATYLKQVGIPVFCAVPLCTSILNFNITSTCSWFSIESSVDYQDQGISLDCDSGLLNNVTNRHVTIPVEKRAIYDIINERARTITLTEAIGLIKVRPNGSNHFMFFGGEYKPVYFLLKEDTTDGSQS